MIDYSLPRTVLDEHPYPLLFATVCGMHGYGCASANSDFDVRGVHVLPLGEMLSLPPRRDAVEVSCIRNGIEIHLATLDALRYLELMLAGHAGLLEQLYSPLVVETSDDHTELKAIGRKCVTRQHGKYYLELAATQWRLFEAEQPARVKPLLLAYRALLTGTHLLRTGQMEVNLIRLNQQERLPIAEPVQRLVAGFEQKPLDAAALKSHTKHYEELAVKLETAIRNCKLPDDPPARDELNAILLRLRRP